MFICSRIDIDEVEDSSTDSGCFETKTCESKLAWILFTFSFVALHVWIEVGNTLIFYGVLSIRIESAS